MADDLRAGIKALLAQWGRDAAGYPGTEPGLYAAAAVRLCANEVRALLAAHPVQDEGTARAAFQEGYEFALIHLDDEPVQADLARLRPDRPVQVTTVEVGEALRQTSEIETAWRYEHQVPMPRLWVLNFLAALGIVVSDRPEETT